MNQWLNRQTQESLRDGAASEEAPKPRIQDRLATYKAAPYNWQFFFAAANQDALKTGEILGLPASDCITFGATPQGLLHMFASMSEQTIQLQMGKPKAFTSVQRSLALTGVPGPSSAHGKAGNAHAPKAKATAPAKPLRTTARRRGSQQRT